MQLCFNAGPEPLEEYFPFAYENGFPWMELSCNNPKNFLSTFNTKRVNHIKKLRDKYSLRYGLHSASFINAAEFEPTVRKAIKKHLLDYKVHEDCEIAYLGVTIEELSRVFKALPSKYLGLTLDVAHASLLPGGTESFIKASPDKIVSTHISDNDLYLDRHLPVGEGKIDFKKIFELLIGVGFKGTLNIELKKNEDRLISKQRLVPILRDLGIEST